VANDPRPPSYLRRDVKRAAQSEPEAVVDGIMAAGELATSRVLAELDARRAGLPPNRPDRTKAGRKARDAQRAEQDRNFTQRWTAALYIDLIVSGLQGAAENVRNAVEAGVMDSAAEARINAALEEFQFAMAEARFKLS